PPRIGFVFPPQSVLFVLSHNMPNVNTTSNWLCSGAFLSPSVPSSHSLATDYWQLSPATDHWPLFSRHLPLATRHSPHDLRGSAVDAARRAGYSSPTRRGQHATTCYVFRFRQKFGEPGFRRKLILNTNLRLFLS